MFAFSTFIFSLLFSLSHISLSYLRLVLVQQGVEVGHSLTCHIKALTKLHLGREREREKMDERRWMREDERQKVREKMGARR